MQQHIKGMRPERMGKVIIMMGSACKINQIRLLKVASHFYEAQALGLHMHFGGAQEARGHPWAHPSSPRCTRSTTSARRASVAAVAASKCASWPARSALNKLRLMISPYWHR